FQVHVDDRIPIVLGHLVEDHVPQDAGHVHDAVDPAEGVDRLLHHALRGLEVGDALAVDDGSTTRLLDDLDDFLSRRLVLTLAGYRTAEIVDHHLRALCSGKDRDLPSDAAAGTGNEDDLTFENVIGHSLFSSSEIGRASCRERLSYTLFDSA